MTVIKICSTELQNIGSLACTKNNPFNDAVSLIFHVPSFEFATLPDFADETKYEDAVKAGSMFILHDIVEIEDQSEDTQYYEAPNGARLPRRLGRYRQMFNFNKGLELHKALQSFRNADLCLIIVDDAGNVLGYSPDGTKAKGFTIDMINPEKMKMAGQDNTPAWTPLAIDLRNAKEWNEKGIYMNPGWDAASLEALSDVEVSVVSSTATEVVLRVAYYEGLDSDGAENLIGVAGVIEADFAFVTTAPSGGDTMVDNADGTYTFPGVAMVTGSVDLVGPVAAASGGSPIKSTGPAVITIA